MKINLSISKRIDAQGHSEILLLIRRRYGSKIIDIRAKSGVFIEQKMFDKKSRTVKTFSANKLMTENVIYHTEQLNKLAALLNRINEAYNNEHDKNKVNGKWLVNVVTGNIRANADNKKNIQQLFDDFLKSKLRAKGSTINLIASFRTLKRFELYTHEMNKNFILDVEKIKSDDIKNFIHYIEHEKELLESHPKIFDKILSLTKQNKNRINYRGGNTINQITQNIKQFFLWLNNEKIINSRPFDGVDMPPAKYGTPYYITTYERDKIASTPMPTKHLETQRDIFVFHCFVGCRVSDLIKLSSANITDGILVYTPHKTKEHGLQSLQARVPLHPNAIKLIEKYNGIDKQGRLFPFIIAQTYNKCIKEIFAIAGITRTVEVRNTITGEIEHKPINEIASSHLARRTFVGNLYSKVADPNLIGKMSGHVDGSRAFARYRKIEDETLKSVIDLL